MKTNPVFLIVFIASCLSVKAIITDDNTAAETNPLGSTGLNWDYVYNYKGSSSVAVDPYWILTAGHVADDGGSGSLTVGATTYYQQEIIFHDTADLALVRYDKALPGYYDLYTGSFSFGQDMIMTGYGNTGTVSSTTFADSGSGAGVKRWGDNEYTFSQTVSYNAGGIVGMTTNQMFYMAFTDGATGNEAGVGVHDSGGGTFVYSAGTWKLAGINTVRSGSADAYTGTYAVSLPSYETWIAQAVPEPTTGIMLVGVAFAFGVIQRIRYMHQ